MNVGDDEAVLTKLLDDVKVELQRIYSTEQSSVDGKDSKSTPVDNGDKPSMPPRPRRRGQHHAEQVGPAHSLRQSNDDKKKLPTFQNPEELQQRIEELERQCAEAESANEKLITQQQQDGVELVTLKKVLF